MTRKGPIFAVSSLAGRGMKELLHRVEAMVLKPLDLQAGEDEEEASEPEPSEEYGTPPHLTDEEEHLPGDE